MMKTLHLLAYILVCAGYAAAASAQHPRNGSMPAIPEDLAARYDGREKTLLEQVLNYTTSGNESGGAIPVFGSPISPEFGSVSGYNVRLIWLSGVNGDHPCRLVGVAVAQEEPITVVSPTGQRTNNLPLAVYDSVDIRSFNVKGFRMFTRGVNTRVGDEGWNTLMFATVLPDRLRNAWSLAFQQCPSATARPF